MSVTYSSRKLSIDQFADFVTKVAKQPKFKSSIGACFESLELLMNEYSLPEGYTLSPYCNYFYSRHLVSLDVFQDRLWDIVGQPWIRSFRGEFTASFPKRAGKSLKYELRPFRISGSEDEGASLGRISDVSIKSAVHYYKWELDTLGFRDRYHLSVVDGDTVFVDFRSMPELNGIAYSSGDGVARQEGLSRPYCVIRPMENAKAAFQKLVNSEAVISSTEIRIGFKENRYAEDYPLAQALGLGPLRLEFEGKPNFTFKTVVEAAKRGDMLSLSLCRFKPKDGLTVAVDAYKDAGDAPVRLQFSFRGEPEAYNRTMNALTELLGYEPILDDDVDGDPLEAEEGEE